MPSYLPQFNWNFHITVTPSILWFGFLILVLVYIVASWIMVYHWDTFGYNIKHKLRVKLIYFVVSLIMLSATALLVWLYGATLQ